MGDKDRVNMDQLASRMEVLRDLQVQVQEMQQERHEHGNAIREGRAQTEKHSQAHDKLARTVGQLSDSVVDNVVQKMKESPGMTPEGFDTELQAIREAIKEATKNLVESITSERHSRQESNTKLREDCRDAIQKEINARVELDKKLSAEIESEARARTEVVEIIELAIQECREGLETHTHELTVDDEKES